MSKLNIYENKWNDLVFENRNKEYGAYQLRQENPRTTVNALFMGLLLITALGSIPVLINKFKPQVVEPTSTDVPFIDEQLVVTPYNPTVAPPPPAPPVPRVEQTTTQVTDARQLINPVVAAPQDAVDDIAPNTDNTPAVVSTSGTGDPSSSVTSPGGGSNGTVISATPTISDGPVSVAVLDKLPEFPGGIAQFYKYVGNNFRRPELDMEKTLKVYVSFVVEKDGSLTDIIVRNDPGYGMGKEAVRVLKSLKTKWSPGILDGKPVRTAYSLPITIKTEME
ncbi:energy transducer TonB [Flavobacterium quisquiliarum]|uniref:Energy transducer TonB n=1 Tax=Flavobacterium quisquiliarum TaxID=1834436 RepID=A0ABV8WBI5_9FLAO|nr:energy transducer TonB [Flavobacterium quisquiliarum]MBW1657808.1 energy transducer TonB [Flavobacterium quisquiliarum]NWL04148.1 energy transducer TonB [Flavobacterium collinsii]